MFTSVLTPLVSSDVPQPTSWYSLLTDFGNLFGYTTYLIGVVALVHGYTRKNKSILALFIYSFLPLFVFSLAVVKRGTYIFLGAPAIFILISWIVNYEFSFDILRRKSFRIVGIMSMMFIAGYSLEKLYVFRTKSRTTEWSERIKNLTPEPGTVLYNEPHYLELMFYHDDITAYEFESDDISEPAE